MFLGDCKTDSGGLEIQDTFSLFPREELNANALLPGAVTDRARLKKPPF